MAVVWTSLVAQMVKSLPTMRKTWVWSLGWEDPLEKELATYSSTLSWKIPGDGDGQGSLASCSPRGCKELDTTERLNWTALSIEHLGDSVVKNLPANAEYARGLGSIPGSGRSPGERNGNPLQYSCPENPMDRGAWRTIVRGVAKNWTWLSDYTLFFLCAPYPVSLLLISKISMLHLSQLINKYRYIIN